MIVARTKTAATILVAAFALAACGGGSQSSLPSTGPTPISSTGPQSQMASVTLTIAVPTPPPASSSSARRAQSISWNTGSVRVSVLSVNGHSVTVPDTIKAIAAGASGCSGTKATGLSCTVTASAPIGLSDAFRISTYASSDGSGSVLSTTTMSAPVNASGQNVLALSLGGVVSSVAISPARLVAPTDGTVQTYQISVTALDASGATIVGTTPFASPVALMIQNDPNHALTLTQPEVTYPGQAVQLEYDSTKQLTDATISAATQTNGTAISNFVPLSYAPNNATVAMGSSGITVQVSEAGFTGQFAIKVADTTVATASITPTVNGQATISISPPPIGSYTGQTTITLTAGTLNATIPVNVIYPVLQTKAWNVQGTGDVMAPSSDGVSYYVGDDGAARVYNFNPQTGTLLTIQPHTPDGVFAITNGPDGNPWWIISGYPQTQLCQGANFQGSYNVNCYNITGAYSQGNSFGIAAGPNNTLWFTISEYQSGIAIGEYNISSGQFTFYTNGLTANANPYSLAFGPDGNVWFTDTSQTAPAIGVLNISTGTITEYPLQAGNGNYGTASVPNDIVAGPDGNMWFTDNSQASPGIGKVTIATHTITMYTKGLQRTPQPYGLTSGPDGNIWFTDNPSPYNGGQDLVGSINPSTGAIQEYSLSVTGLQPEPIITLGSKLETISTFGMVGQNPSAWAAEITLPGSSGTSSARRRTPTTTPKR